MKMETISTNNTDYNKKEQTREKLKNIGENISGIVLLISSIFMFQFLLTMPVTSTEAKSKEQVSYHLQTLNITSLCL